MSTVSDTIEKTETKNLVEIYLPQTEIHSASVQVAWKIDKSILEQNVGNKLYIVLFCFSEDKDLETTVSYTHRFDVVDMLAYVSFEKPGPNRIIAVVTSEPLYLMRLQRDNYPCASALKFWAAEMKMPVFFSNDLDLDVPEDCFAKEPTAFDKAWVNYMVPYALKDECAYRRRRLFAYTVQPIIFAFIMLWRILATLFLVLAGYRPSFLPIVDPLNHTSGDISNNSFNATIFNYSSSMIAKFEKVFKEAFGDRPPSAVQGIFFVMGLLVPIFTIAGLAFAEHEGVFNILHTHMPFIVSRILIISMFLLTPAIVIVLLQLPLLLTYVLTYVFLVPKLKEPVVKNLGHQFNEALLLGSNTKVSIKDFSFSKRIKLRLKQLKSEICRPFAK